jgi:hypothetical protein
MSLRMMPDKQSVIWLTCGVTAVYTLIIALAFHPSADVPSKAFELLFWEGLFAGPVVVASILSISVARVKTRRILLVFVVSYSILTATVFYWTFGVEHDAQYQLMLLLVPLIGFPSVMIAGLAGIMTR